MITGPIDDRLILVRSRVIYRPVCGGDIRCSKYSLSLCSMLKPRLILEKLAKIVHVGFLFLSFTAA
jgi:hypothetical protein